MIKYIKNLLVILAITFSCNAISQNDITIEPGQYSQWSMSNQTCYGCGSFLTMVVNNPVQSKGYYYYDIYFWSNSFYTNGYAANTYIKQVNIYAQDPSGRNTLVLTFPYTVVPPKSDAFNGYFYVGYVYSTSAMQKIKITWSNVNVW